MASEELHNTLIKTQIPVVTAAQSASQTTTNSYAGVDESVLDTSGRNVANYAVKNTGANTITAKLQGRLKNAAGAFSDWIDIGTPAPADAAAGATTNFLLTDCPWAEVRVAVVSKVGGSHGAAQVIGGAKVV